ncbi:MAG: AzlD domain-containing protein [Chloroflexi bacterium]|nr:AzlD domain-containing protein [Chloroflexota bacterium]
MNIWIIMIAIGLLTFATRLSFIALLERIKLPVTFQRALRFVPIAILSAIIAPELGYANNVPALTFGNPRLLAGLVATLVAYRTKNIIWTILAGMVVFWGLKLAFGL